jgi:GNAT superfamily N-acetyltransferase
VSPRPHPLAALLDAAAHGAFPDADGAIEIFGSPPGPSDAVVAFSSHNVIAAQIDPAEVHARLPPGDPGAPMYPGFLAWLGERLGSSPGMIDLVMVAFARPTRAPGDTSLPLVPTDGAGHPRVDRAVRYRTDVAVYSDSEHRGLAILGRGLAGRREVSIEVAPDHRGAGLGRALAEAAASLVPRGEPLFAQVTPGNVASVRTFLAAGYRPVCSEVLFLRGR